MNDERGDERGGDGAITNVESVARRSRRTASIGVWNVT